MRKKAEIYTRTGDKGTTGLFGGSRVDKDSLRVEAYGTIDELCAVISIVKSSNPDARIFEILTNIQNDCYRINAELASDKEGIKMLTQPISEKDVSYLESLIDNFNADLPKLDRFIVPAEKMSAAYLNLARTVCRRAERRLWALLRENTLNENIIKFVNRLSDLLFIMMRIDGSDGI